MRISVIIPLYNARAYLAQAIDSILAQTLPADEIIVVDDGSTDGSAAVLARYGTVLQAFRQDNRGPASAINRGLRAATGDAIAFLDADDVWMPDKLRLECSALADPSLDGVFGHIVLFLSEDAAAAEGRYVLPDDPMPGINRTTLLVLRSAFDKFGLFDESLRTTDFVPWYARAVALGFRSTTLSEVVARRRLHLTNTGIRRRTEQQQESLQGLRQALAIRRERSHAIKPEQP